jgi:diacylglycerol kinase (ATP)
VVDEVKRAFAAVGVTEVRVTAGAGDERTLTRRAVEQGYDTVVAVGGDGTWSNVANAILETGSECRLALVAAGTGNDFARTVGIPVRDLQAAARMAVEGPVLEMDVGRIEGRHFLNIAGFGFDIAVLEDVGKIPFLKGDALYRFSALRQLVGYRGVEIRVDRPGGSGVGGRHLMLIVANACYFGGDFHIAPAASLVDGRLDAVSILDVPPHRRFGLFGDVAKGAHVARSDVVTQQSERFTLRFPAPPAYETDGEYRRAASAELEITCVPRALRLVTPLGARTAAAAALAAPAGSARDSRADLGART